MNLDRFEICEVYHVLEVDYNVSGILQERKSNIRRNMSTGYQLHRMGFKPRPNLTYDSLEYEQKVLYNMKLCEYGLNIENKEEL